MALVTTGVVVLDCAEPEKLAEFYKELLEAEHVDATANRVELRSADGFRLALRRDMNATAPSWPRPENSSRRTSSSWRRTWTGWSGRS